MACRMGGTCEGKRCPHGLRPDPALAGQEALACGSNNRDHARASLRAWAGYPTSRARGSLGSLARPCLLDVCGLVFPARSLAVLAGWSKECALAGCAHVPLQMPV